MKKEKNIPLYTTIYNDIIAKIKSGKLKVGDKLPTEMELCGIYGVSRITVARALNDLTKINLLYRIKKSGTFVNGKLDHNVPLFIPVILPFEENFNEILTGLQAKALESNAFTPFYNSKNNILRERSQLQEILNNNLDGLIVYPCNSLENIDLYAKILSKNIPIVCIDRRIEGLRTPLVTTNNQDSMKNIVDILVSLGHTKIGFFAINEQMIQTEADRFTGFCKGIIENGLELHKEFIYNVSDLHKKEINMTPEQQEKILQEYVDKEIKRYLGTEDKPTAVCCLNDSLLETLLKRIKKHNVSVSRDLVLTGFDCVNAEKSREQGIITVKQNFYQLGVSAMSLMLNILDGQPYSYTQYVKGIPVNAMPRE